MLALVYLPVFAQSHPPPQNAPAAAPAATETSLTPQKRIDISPRVALKMLLKHDAPQYPTEAIAAGIQGMVVLWAQIDVNGRVSDLKIVNGPSVFQKVAMDSAQKWIYKPFLVDGKPVEVNTKIYLVFTMENHRASVYSSAP
jgi:protein TonB